MRLFLAIIIPWLQFFTIGRPIAGIICFLLQITLIGWIPAAIWSVFALGQYKTDRKIERALRQPRLKHLLWPPLGQELRVGLTV